MNIIFGIILGLLIGYGALITYLLNVPRVLHFAQLEGYHISDFMRFITKNPRLLFMEEVPQFLGVIISYLFITVCNRYFLGSLSVLDVRNIIAIECFALLFIYILPNIHKAILDSKKRKDAKKKLEYTPRAKRLIFWNMIAVYMLEILLMTKYMALSDKSLYNLMKPVYYSFFTLTMPVNMIIAIFLSSPTERFISNFYIGSARRKLKSRAYKNLIRIGITGSYGKTSTKFILQTILSEKFKVLATPESYNTTMGNVKVIRKILNKEHQIFISEMGAKFRGDIQEICDFVKPQIGIITAIGPQHLESFKTVDNIVKTKAELINSLPSDGTVFLPNDDSHCLRLYNNEKRKKFLYSLKDKHSDVYAKDIKVSSEGVSFTAVTPIGEIFLSSKLLGEHNVQNILCGVSVAIFLGLSKDEIISGVSKIEPIEHRLQIIDNSNGITVIDDAFNSNPEGSKMALEVLKSFDGRKIIITPGMVELGKDEERYNIEFGRQMASSVDIAILVGNKRSEPIVKGLKDKHFNEMDIFVVDSLKSASEKLSEISRQGDVVLFENDLPIDT